MGGEPQRAQLGAMAVAEEIMIQEQDGDKEGTWSAIVAEKKR